MELRKLIEKFSGPAPRYNCYPAAPYWKSPVDTNKWLRTVGKSYKALNDDSGMILYLHMPFCESMCRFCGFEKRITQNHFVEEVYIEALTREWSLYREYLGGDPRVTQVYMGGGVPLLFSVRITWKGFTGTSSSTFN